MTDTHRHECPQCGKQFDCGEGGWHAIDYRWYTRCEDCAREAERVREAAAAAEGTPERQAS